MFLLKAIEFVTGILYFMCMYYSYLFSVHVHIHNPYSLYVDFMSGFSHLTELDRLKNLEEEQDQLNSSLLALTTHFAQVQFRLKQIVTAPADEKEVGSL